MTIPMEKWLQRPYRIYGLIGLPGSGKSEVAKLMVQASNAFTEQGRPIFSVVDVDAMIPAVLGTCRQALLDEFDIPLDISNEEAKKVLSAIVFKNLLELDRLEEITKIALVDVVVPRIMDLCYQGPVIVDYALLRKSGLAALCDLVICVECEFYVRLRRVEKRGWGFSDLNLRDSLLMAQAYGDIYLHNNDEFSFTKESLKHSVTKLVRTLQRTTFG